jgi:hypothetical protein
MMLGIGIEGDDALRPVLKGEPDIRLRSGSLIQIRQVPEPPHRLWMP